MGSTQDLPSAQRRMGRGEKWIWKGKRMSRTAPHGRWRWGWGQLKESTGSLTIYECAASTTAEVQPAGREIMPCTDQEEGRRTTRPLEWPWSWESPLPHHYCEEAVLCPQESYWISVSLSWVHIFLGFYKVFCLWIHGSPCVVTAYLGKQIRTKQEVEHCTGESSISGIQRPRLHRVGKRKRKCWNSLKINH